MQFKHVLLFTGHMIDAPTRKEPRFPAGMETLVAVEIDKTVRSLIASDNHSLYAISGGARGGDMLFLEACRKQGIQRQMVIGRSFETFLENFARNIPGNWQDRASRIWEDRNTRQDICIAPANVHRYQYVNDHMLTTAQEIGGKVTLIALWDGVKRGKGGPSDFIARARGKADICEIDICRLADCYRRS